MQIWRENESLKSFYEKCFVHDEGINVGGNENNDICLTNRGNTVRISIRFTCIALDYKCVVIVDCRHSSFAGFSGRINRLMDVIHLKFGW